ncbi:50S ribosomal protein L20 [Fuerstiella marisgermanici]|uniref:Large ribosomal subunit protein bL20 n=1 Tax=Fuerstiella marisgermanici TaxID=1891926 RepID=A0A1P8WSB1_9PLAN|nr:50S ribosomal protein L20 [Fuerstiella marisgermanici]APZ96962.1 50S ribosomal protein L20 [Fuerstiella marisgermanici]
MRVRYGKARRRSKKRLFKEAKGNFGGRSKLLRTVKETVIRSRVYAYRDRRVRKRMFRQLWITRLTAACRERGISYSQFINGLKVANLELNRKTLSDLAVLYPQVFDEVVEQVKAAKAAA